MEIDQKLDTIPIVSTIAASVEEQSGAGNHIAININQASSQVNEVNDSMLQNLKVGETIFSDRVTNIAEF